jgi:16S rRNA (cytosine967-C5)-methyltransferase
MSGTSRPGGGAGKRARRAGGQSKPGDGKAGRPATRPAADPARQVAFETLRAIDERNAYANLTLPGLIRETGLTGRDAALATELTYGTLRGSGTYDAIIAASVDRPLGEIDPPVLDVLRLGAHQLLAMRVPAHAAVSTSVDLAGADVGIGPSKFVNAVLRKVAAADMADWVERLAPAETTDPIERLAIEHSHPAWIVRALRDALSRWPRDSGHDHSTVELAEALAADNDAPAVTLVARPGRSTVDELVAAGAVPTRYSPYGAVLGEGDPASVPAVREQRAGVQDEGSQLVTLALAGADVYGPDAEWLDMCAGPGGKAALLGALAGERGARLTALEVAPHRARLVQQALESDVGGHRLIVGDARVDVPDSGSYDRVLLDAPCTGLGALRRRPEARWRRTPQDVPALRKLQAELLGSALRAVRPGGIVAYVTCSPHLAETRSVVDAERQQVERIDARPYLPGVSDLGPGPDIQLWPHRHGTDAMYLALLRR